MKALEWINNRRDSIFIILFVTITLLVGGLIGYAKLRTLVTWGYTSDLFTFDTILQETLHGHFAMEFTYGNSFGDHAWPILFLLLPLKQLLQVKMVDGLLLIGPITFILSSLVMFYAMRSSVGSAKAFMLALSSVFGFSIVFRGLLEPLYGFHPDTIAGFVACAFTSFLIWRQENLSQGKKGGLQLAGFWVFFVVFLSLKEQMALLACLYFFVAFVLLRNRLNLLAFILAILAFLGEYAMILTSQTPFNRTNNALLSTVIEGFRANGLRFLFQDQTGAPLNVVVFWGLLLTCAASFSLVFWFAKKRNIYAVSLFLTGLATALMSISASDFSIYTWHNFPGFFMLIGAILWQVIDLEITLFRSKWVISVMVLSISCVGMFARDIPFVVSTLDTANKNAPVVLVLNDEIEKIKQFVPPERIVAIPVFSAVQWADYRYSFYPRGLTMSPVGIADYVVFPVNVSTSFTFGWEKTVPLEKFQSDFHLVTQTDHFLLFRRIAITESDRLSRENFNRIYGLPPMPY